MKFGLFLEKAADLVQLHTHSSGFLTHTSGKSLEKEFGDFQVRKAIFSRVCCKSDEKGQRTVKHIEQPVEV